ncbi:uncharacterized protein LOC122074441 [Macadamia integrifolia]|uniref:uncharacterized protein LOC122074441 n=1 Tax=Macadamia integrifolia TaxID=60698 RepID=UPI001C4F798D|nr:uncharacterized protein LOC122074441 [Macadamia integrifolia]
MLQDKKLQAIKGPRGVQMPGFLLFADNIFFFLNGSIRYVRHFNVFLTKYQQFSGQQINLNKSKLFLGKMSLDRKQLISDTLGISICKFPTKYLGVEIFKDRVTREPLLPVMGKIKGRMAGWKGKLLSMAGRVELVRSLISGMPSHNFSVYWWSSSLLNIMGRWMRNFIWSGDPETAKGVTINWDSICKPKQEGGLGIRRLRDVNKALLCKHVWNIRHSSSALSNIINARFLRKNGELKKGYKSSTIWPGLRRMWSLVSSKERWVVGNGVSINFWKDRWVDSKSFQEKAGLRDDLFASSSMTVADFIDNNEWNFPTCISDPLGKVFLSCFGLIWKDQSSIAELISWWKRKRRILSVKDPWAAGLIIVTDTIWQERNHRWHGGKSRDASLLFKKILRTLKESNLNLKGVIRSAADLLYYRKLGLHAAPGDPPSILEIIWCKPPLAWQKINIDGSSMGNPRRAGGGGVICDSNGKVIFSFKHFLGISTNYYAEFMRFLHGIRHAMGQRITNLWIETDSVAVVTAVQGKSLPWFALQEWLSL